MLQLNLGSGTTKMQGYVSIDKYSDVADLKIDAAELPYLNNTVDKIYTAHMVEHVTLGEFRKMLKEWRRVLKFGGILMIRCPNIEAYLKRWLAGDYKLRWGEGIHWLLGFTSGGVGHINRNFFTAKRMQQIIKDAGFRVRRCTAYPTRSGHMPDGDVLCEAVK